MNKIKCRYRVSFEQGGCAFKSFTNDIDEAVRFALEKEVVSDHIVSIFDTRRNKCIFPLQ